jgi:hypothetical protein
MDLACGLADILKFVWHCFVNPFWHSRRRDLYIFFITQPCTLNQYTFDFYLQFTCETRYFSFDRFGLATLLVLVVPPCLSSVWVSSSNCSSFTILVRNTHDYNITDMRMGGSNDADVEASSAPL